MLLPRQRSLLSPISLSEVIIMGGYNDDDDRFLGDIILYDTKVGTFKPIPSIE